MVFEKKIRTTEEKLEYDEKEAKRNQTYIYHYCLNENLPKEHPDFCFNCWIDECEHYASEQQNWKYCSSCEAKGFPEFTMETRKDGYKIHTDMCNHLKKYTKATREIVQRNGNKLLNGHTEADLELVFDKFYPDVKMVKGIYKEGE